MNILITTSLVLEISLNLWLICDYAHSALLFYVNWPYVNSDKKMWLDKDEKVPHQPDSSILSSVQADSSCQACLTTGQSERPFSAWTRACTSQQWIAGQLHLVYARVCVSVWLWGWGSYEWGLCPTLPIFNMTPRELTWQPKTPNHMQWSVSRGESQNF